LTFSFIKDFILLMIKHCWRVLKPDYRLVKPLLRPLAYLFCCFAVAERPRIMSDRLNSLSTVLVHSA